MKVKNYYAILGIDSSATEEEIKAAYRKQVRQYHPDKNFGKEQFDKHFRLIQEAYDNLKDSKKRDDFDAKLAYDTYTSDPKAYAKFVKEQKDKPKKYKKPEPNSKRWSRSMILNSVGAVGGVLAILIVIVNLTVFKDSNSKNLSATSEIDYSNYDKITPEQLTEDYLKRAMKYFDEGNLKFSMIYFQKAMAESPLEPKLYFNRGIVHYVKKNLDAALTDFNMTISLDSTYKNAFWMRAKLKYDMDDNEGAITDFTQAIKFDPTNDSLYFNRGLAYYYIGHFDEAIADIDKAIELNPGQPQYYFDRGDAKEMTGSLEGCSDWQKAKDLGYHSIEYKLKNCVAEN